MTNLDVKPPWVEYPGNDPWWGGWRQGASEVWLLNEWLPFWKTLSVEAKDTYLQKWPPPNDDWHIYLYKYWT